MKLSLLLLSVLIPAATARVAVDPFAGNGSLPPEVAIQLKKAKGSRPPTNSGGRGKKTPEQQRGELLKKLQIDRTPSGILEARLKHRRNLEKAAEPKPKEEPKKEEVKKEEPKKELTPQEKRRAEQQQKRKEDQKKLKQYKADIEALRLSVILGNWTEVKDYLATLPDQDAASAFSTIVSKLGSQVKVNPRPELSSIGAPGHSQPQYLRPHEIIALSDTAKKVPDNGALEGLARLIDHDNRPPQSFFDALKSGTVYFGLKDADTRHRTAKLLIDAHFLKEAVTFLPSVEESKKDKKFASLNLIARFHAEAHQANLDHDNGKTHLPQAWQLSLGLIGEKKAPLNQRGEALYRALALVPELEGETGQTWLKNTFANAEGEGFEILAAVGTLTAQTRNHRTNNFRLEQLKLQSAAASALLGQEGLDLTPWKETLTLYIINWNAEAQRTQQLDTTSSMRMRPQWDDYGNVFYTRQQGSYRGDGPIPITAGELLDIRPSAQWLSQIDEQVHLTYLSRAAQLFLKVKEEEKAFPLLKEYAVTRPEKAKDLVRTLIKVWAENNNPNQQNQYRSHYSYFWGHNERAQSIPLTRSKQERNLKKLSNLVTQIKALGLDDTFEEELAGAFTQCHSQAEVWRVETLETVFGSVKNIDPGTLASLVSRMRTNLIALWPNPKVQQKAKTKRTDKERHAQILQGYLSAGALCQDALEANSDHRDRWKIETQLAALFFEGSNYQTLLQPHPQHSTIKRQSLDALAQAAKSYIGTLPLEDETEESLDAFTNWFYGALGSPELAGLKAEHQPTNSEFAKIKAALDSIPEPSKKRHLERFAKTINTRLANIPPDLKHRFLESALPITGDHKNIEEAADLFRYYQDLVTEIELQTRVDGTDSIDASEPFGLFVNIRHTKEIERESGGFQRYLINQNQHRWTSNYRRPTEDYRDKFEKSSRTILEEHFEVISITFHSDKIQSQTDPEIGWSYTPYAYFLLKPKGPEIDSIPPIKIDLDFLDTTGYVVLPITSAAIPIDASVKDAPRPYRDLQLTLTLDERKAEKENLLYLEIRSVAHGLIPPLDRLLTLPPKGFEITNTEDRELQLDELDPETQDGAPLSSHEWRLTLKPTGDTLPANFTFPEVLATTGKEEGLTLQKYEDVDLVTVSQTTPLTDGSDDKPTWWIYLTFIVGIIIAGALYFFRKKAPELEVDTGPELPATLTPVTLLTFLNKLHTHPRLEEKHKTGLTEAIKDLQSRAFAPKSTPPPSDELKTIANKWQQTFVSN